MEAREAMASEKSRSNISNLSTLNRFQRSSLSKKIPGAHKDSTSALAEFLDDAVESIERYIDCIGATVDSSQCWKRRKHLLRNVFLFLTRIFRSACVLPFNEAHFQAILSHGRRLLKTFHAEELGDHTRDLLKHIANLLDDSFVDGFTLTTGLCMEPLWAAFRPAVVADEKKFDQLVELETLANNFDALRWRIKASADELARFTRAFVDAYGSLRDRTTNDDGLIRTLSSEVASLELRIGHGTPEQLPFFSEQFEGLRQVLYLHLGDHNPQGIGNWWQAVVLANQPTSRELSFRSSRETTRNLYSVGYLMGDALKEHPWADQVSTSIVARLQAIPQANLLQLQSLEQELPLLGRLVTQHSEAIIGPHFAKLRRLLMQLLESVASASQEDLWQTLTSLYLRTANRGGVNSQVISSYATALELQADTRPSMDDGRSPPQPLDNDLAKAMLSLASDDATLSGNPRFLALAWIHFSVACVRLYVPDKIYDPQMAALAESSFLEELAAEIQRELEALQLFNYRLTGREQNTRVRLLEEELRTPLSQAPREAPTFYRPAASQLSALQAEFNNTIRTVLGSDIAHEVTRVFEDGSEASRQQLILVRNNIAHIVERLSARFRAYEDLTAPLINILQCLQLGLSLIPRPDEDFSSSELCAVVWSTTPFLGGKLATIDGLDNRSMPTDSLELLEIFGTVVSLEGIDSLKGPTRQSFFRCIHSFYKQWTRKLDADRKAEEAKRSLYRFKGSPEDEEEIDEEEFNQLFPTGDPSNAETRKPAKNLVRDVSVKLAMAHRQVVMSPKSAEESLRSLLLTATEITTKAGHSRLTESQILPGAMLALADCLESVQALTSSQNYSFYADVNLAETRRLASLVHRIQTRFRELQLAEEIGHHQILADVILACDKVLQAGHREPLALLISRVEQLHTHVYEWEFGGWAAKSYNAATLYEELTELLVSWRRLELSTWSRLFDAEMRACEDDANSWWFIAYQAVVVAPVSLIEEDRPDELSAYAVTLLSELETYFANALLGQFSTRLTLLKQLLRHVQMMRMDLPELSIIATGVQNFIDFYSHYEGPVAEAIQQGRKPLEKTMKDILLLASWRDTNIVALRESARRSHQKLFRIVKKFRAVLSRPASEVINQGLPEASHREQSRMFAAVSGQISPVDMSAIEICSTQLGWSESNKRLASLPTTLKRMANLGALPQHASLAATEISETMSSLVVAIDELRKETPSTLTEENGGHVKALKNRKQKLFASTLRDLRYMGFKDNLSTQILSGQDSLAKVMVHAGSFLDAEDSYLREVDDQLHHVLDLAPRVRAAAQEHSEDLTQAEVQRAVGLMEGMLHIILKQRRTLAGYLASLRKLQLAMMPLRALSATSEANGVERATTHSNCWRVLKWLPEVLQLGIHLVEIHGRLGNLKNADACDLLRRYRDQLRQLWHEEQQLPDLPLGFITARHLKNEKAIDDTLERLRADLRSLIEARPDLRFILEKLEDWTNPLVPTEIENTPHQSVESIVQPVSRFSDQILVAIQRYNRAASTLPTSTSNEKWLMGYDSAMALMLSELHMRQVSDKLELVVRDSCYSHTGAKGARLLQPVFAVLLPIVERYEQTCRNALAAYGELHLSVSKMAHNLSRIFVRLAAQGYCMPQEKSEETSGESGKLESGTGLGDGEGAQDISNDIQPDEDLSELSKEKNQERGEEIQGEKDAVDMDGEELEGDIASISEGEDDEEKDGEGPDAEGEEEGDIDEEVGDVDDLDPTAVDEKMWEGKDEDEAEKDQKGNKAKGETKPETGAGGEQEDVDGDDEGDMNQGDDDDGVADEEDAKDFEDLNRQDQNVQENDTLALPEEMELDMDANQESDSESSDDLDDLEDHGPEAEEKDEDQASEGSVDDINYDTRDPTHEDADDNDADEMDDLEPDEVDSMGDVEDAETQKNDEQSRTKEKSLDRTDAADGDAREDGQDNAQDQAAEQEDMDDAATSEKDEGNRGQGTSKQEEKDGDRGPQPASKHSTTEDLESGLKEQQETPVSNPFKKLGDVLEKWLRQTRDIKSAQQEQESQESAAEPRDVDLSEQQEFQHLSYDEAAADTQVLGAVPAEEEGRTWDDPMVLEDDEDSRPMQPDNADDEQLGEDNELETQPMDKEGIPADEARSGVQTRQGITERDETADGGDARETDEEEDIKETSSHLSATHISAPSSELPQSYSTALQLWTQYQTKTHALSLALTAQLRLILTPTQSTKLSGAFRTGKRLAIKRIIPYIASGYKRDKIWLRRAVPTKRAYQILVCVDDSLSMREHRAGPMALESLVMLARALAMLEVGQVGVLGFGKTVFAAHDLVGGGAGTVSPPLSSPDTGARALQHFSFAQDGTDLELLVRDVLSRFAAARASGPRQGPGGESLWQLALILSDGFAPYRTHAELRRLLRRATEERVMFVFIVLDSAAVRRGDSILDFKGARIVKDDQGNSTVVVERYLDSFPFQYYLIVHDIDQLPGALAGLLRTWFAEVNA